MRVFEKGLSVNAAKLSLCECCRNPAIVFKLTTPILLHHWTITYAISLAIILSASAGSVPRRG
jgi:hypothetical protein